MKKLFAVLTALLCVMSFAVAEEAEDLTKAPTDTKTRTIVPEDQHVTNKTASVYLDYTPSTDEVRIYYKVMAVSYDEGEAMNTVLECLKDFQVQNQYYGYKYLRRDSKKYVKDEKNIRWAIYESHVKFNR
ncbi:hypothetical protein [Treponema zioleckii]|uniref:hypothetical protein n=1 Tax=Treponema zioleckii TaxID=331680 RepID=UPI00168BFEAB|nr:hypothetical protein [Treponema zioleckii]